MSSPLPFDLHVDLITVGQAAQLAGVSKDVIRQWKRRGHLATASTTIAGRPLFHGIDVLRAQVEIPRKRRRRSGTQRRDELTQSA